MLGVTSQTPFTHLANVKDLNFVQGGGGKILLRCVLQAGCKLHTKTREKGEVSQNLLTRIVAVGGRHAF